MATKTELINKALTLIGAAPIVSITDSSNNARIANRVYDSSLRSLLSECAWNFAVKRALLATSSETLAWYHSGITIVYARPSDCIRIFGTNDVDATWYEEGDLIISDTSDLGIRYVQYLDTTSRFPSSFTEAFIDRLCADMAFAILNSAKIAQVYIEKYERVSLPKARSENAQVGEQQFLQDDAWELAKYNNSNTDA
uniref:Putative tail tubular protein n=1 Tax=viral metagenome TaxID=1070528 RepID=A0A6M3IQX2_9ZZZZ